MTQSVVWCHGITGGHPWLHTLPLKHNDMVTVVRSLDYNTMFGAVDTEASRVTEFISNTATWSPVCHGLDVMMVGGHVWPRD